MKSFTVYDVSTGRILRTGTCQDETFDAQAMNSGESVGEFRGAWATQYIVSGQLQSRPPSTVTLTKSGHVITLNGVQAGVQPEAASDSAIASLDATTDGSAIQTTLSSGTYTITVEQFPELLFSQQIIIT